MTLIRLLQAMLQASRTDDELNIIEEWLSYHDGELTESQKVQFYHDLQKRAREIHDET